MPFARGTPKPPGSGRKKGTANKATAEVKDMVLEALHKAGGADYLHACATDRSDRVRAAFLNLAGKLIPRDQTIAQQTLVEIRQFVLDRTTGRPGLRVVGASEVPDPVVLEAVKTSA